jgi:hypothetical protein
MNTIRIRRRRRGSRRRRRIRRKNVPNYSTPLVRLRQEILQKFTTVSGAIVQFVMIHV